MQCNVNDIIMTDTYDICPCRKRKEPEKDKVPKYLTRVFMCDQQAQHIMTTGQTDQQLPLSVLSGIVTDYGLLNAVAVCKEFRDVIEQSRQDVVKRFLLASLESIDTVHVFEKFLKEEWSEVDTLAFSSIFDARSLGDIMDAVGYITEDAMQSMFTRAIIWNVPKVFHGTESTTLSSVQASDVQDALQALNLEELVRCDNDAFVAFYCATVCETWPNPQQLVGALRAAALGGYDTSLNAMLSYMYPNMDCHTLTALSNVAGLCSEDVCNELTYFIAYHGFVAALS